MSNLPASLEAAGLRTVDHGELFNFADLSDFGGRMQGVSGGQQSCAGDPAQRGSAREKQE